MAVVRFPIHLMERWTGEKAEKIAEVLNSLGFPTEVGEEIEVETTPDRVDMLSGEMAAYAVRLFLEKEKPKRPKVKGAALSLENRKPRKRPFIAALVVKNIKDREWLVEGLIQLQEKLHETLGRKRKKVAIGIHALEKVEGPLVYEEGEDAFIPLEGDREMTPKEVLEHTEQGKAYGALVEGGPYPLLKDQRGVIAFPPIINSDRTKIDEGTVDFFIDVTGTHRETVEYVAELFAWALSIRGGEIHGVDVDGEVFPKLKWKAFSPEEIKEAYLHIMGEELESLKVLERMGYTVEGEVRAPSYRYDAWSPQDVVEDILIVKDYNSIEPRRDFAYSSGRALHNSWGELAAEMGFVETYGFFLGNETFYHLISPYVKKIANPLTAEANALRPSLLASLLQTALQNKMKELPQRIFEEGHIYDGKEREEKGFLIADKELDINEGLRLLKELELRLQEKWEKGEGKLEDWNLKGVFIEGRWAVFEGERHKALVGEIHPSLLERLGLPHPVVVILVRRK